jgi:hypothetical protein
MEIQSGGCRTRVILDCHGARRLAMTEGFADTESGSGKILRHKTSGTFAKKPLRVLKYANMLRAYLTQLCGNAPRTETCGDVFDEKGQTWGA